MSWSILLISIKRYILSSKTKITISRLNLIIPPVMIQTPAQIHKKVKVLILLQIQRNQNKERGKMIEKVKRKESNQEIDTDREEIAIDQLEREKIRVEKVSIIEEIEAGQKVKTEKEIGNKNTKEEMIRKIKKLEKTMLNQKIEIEKGKETEIEIEESSLQQFQKRIAIRIKTKIQHCKNRKIQKGNLPYFPKKKKKSEITKADQRKKSS